MRSPSQFESRAEEVAKVQLHGRMSMTARHLTRSAADLTYEIAQAKPGSTVCTLAIGNALKECARHFVGSLLAVEHAMHPERFAIDDAGTVYRREPQDDLAMARTLAALGLDDIAARFEEVVLNGRDDEPQATDELAEAQECERARLAEMDREDAA